MIVAHVPSELHCRSTAYHCRFGNSQLLERHEAFVTSKSIGAGVRPEAFDHQFRNTFPDPVQRAVAGGIFKWKYQDSRRVGSHLNRSNESENYIYEDMPHTAIILDLTMRIALDIRKINQFGVGTYIWNLVRNIAAIDTQNEYLLIGSHRNVHELGPLPANFKQLYQPEEDRFWRNNVLVPLALRNQHVDVLHVPHHEAPYRS